MYILLDKNFIKNYNTKIVSFQKESINDYFKFLQKLRKIKIRTNFSDIDFENEIKNNNILLENLINLGPPHILYNQELNDFENRKGSGSPYLFLFSEDESVNSFLIKSGFECISSSDFNVKWPVYSPTRSDKHLKVTNDESISSELIFNSYNNIRKFAHPLHSVVIFDRYILKNKRNQRIENNLFPLIKNLIISPPEEQVLDFMIITQFEENNPNDIIEKYELINDFLQTNYNGNRINFSLVEYSSYYRPKGMPKLHSRRIYTNNFVIKSENSFTFFNEKGEVECEADVYFEFAFGFETPEFIMSELKDLKKYIDNLPQKVPVEQNGIKLMYYPDKKNRLFDILDSSD